MKKRVFQVALAMMLVCVSSPVAVSQAPQSVAAPEISPGLSMKETEAWIKRELRPMGSDHIVTTYKGSTWADKYDIDSALLSECVLTIRQVKQHEVYLKDGTVFAAPNRPTNTSRITMKDVDVGKSLSVREEPVVPDTTYSKPTYWIRVVALSDRGNPFLSETDGYAGGPTSKPVRAVSIRVRDQNVADQASEVFRRAAVLCGAPNQPVVTPMGVPLRLPSTYVNAQTPADQLQLNADHSLSLQEAGQTYRGTFAVNGNLLEITIPDTNTKTAMTSQGSNLVDPNGQTWALQTAPALNTASPAALRNEDVIKLARVGIDDSIIIAKIGSSKCQFDTSVDALIQLKESGVTPAVLKAMVGAQAMGGATLAVPPPNATPPVTEGPKPVASPVPVQPSSPCPDIDYLGVIQAVTGGGQMAGTNAYGGRVRNRASYTKEVDFAWIMNGRAETGTFRVPAGQFIDVNLGQGPAQPTNVRVTGCR